MGDKSTHSSVVVRASEQGLVVRAISRRVYYGWAIVGAIFTSDCVLMVYVASALSVFVTPLSEEFGWSRSTIAGALSVGTLLGAVLSPIVGPLIDRKGARLTLVLGGLAVALALLGLSRVTAVWQFYLAYALGRAINHGVLLMAGGVAVANWFVLRRGRAIAIAMSGHRVGGMFIPLSLQGVMLVAGWRSAWVLAAALVLLFQVVPAALIIRRRPEDLGLRPDGLSATAEGTGSAQLSSQQQRDVSWSLREAAHTPAMWLIGVTVGLAAMVMSGVWLHFVPHLTDRGLAQTTAVLMLTLQSGVGVLGGIVWGVLTERVHVRYVIGALFLVWALAMLLLTQVASLSSALVATIFVGLAVGGWTIISQVVFAEYFGRGSLGAIRGVMTPLQLGGQAIGAIASAWVFDTTGSYNIAFVTYAFTMLLGVVLIALARPPRRRSLHGETAR